MENTITIEKGLAAHFKQTSGHSRAGVDWAVRIFGARAGTVIVRTYFSSSPPERCEQQALANRSILFIEKKPAQGWIPQPGILEAE
jgi:hypothetical protein